MKPVMSDGVGRIHGSDQVFTHYRVIFFGHKVDCDFFGQVQEAAAAAGMVGGVVQVITRGESLVTENHFLGYVQPDGHFLPVSE